MVARSIHDYQFFGGKGAPQFPKGNAVKHEMSAETAGGIKDYPCFSEDIKATQDANSHMIKKHPQKKDHRN